MKMKICGLWGCFFGLVLAVIPATPVQAFDDLEKTCQTQAAVAMNVSRSDVQVRRGENRNDGSGNYILLWEARLHEGTRSRGYCQVDPGRHQIVRFESSEYSGGSSAYISPEDAEKACRAEAARRLGVDFPDVGTGKLRSSDNGSYRIKWYTDSSNGNNSSGSCVIDRSGSLVRFDQDGSMGGGPPDLGPVGDYPRVKVDTGGDGTFDGGRFRNVHLESVYLDTRERPTLVLRGSHEFRIAFNGEVMGASKREFTLRINGSDHGDVHGRVEIRLNPDRNEVETLDFRGTIDGSELNSSFVGRH